MIHRLEHLLNDERLRELGEEELQKSLGEFDQGVEMSEGRVTRGQSQVAAPAQASQALNFHLCLLIRLALTMEK